MNPLQKGKFEKSIVRKWGEVVKKDIKILQKEPKNTENATQVGGKLILFQKSSNFRRVICVNLGSSVVFISTPPAPPPSKGEEIIISFPSPATDMNEQLSEQPISIVRYKIC